MIDVSKDCKFESFKFFGDPFFILKTLTRFSACLTESFFSIILLATCVGLSKPISILAWPVVNFFSLIKLITSVGNENLLPQFTNSIELNYTRKVKGGSITLGTFYRNII